MTVDPDLLLELSDAIDQRPLRQNRPVEFHQHPCPDCGAPLVLKLGKYGRFYGCQKYSETFCHGSVTEKDHIPLSSPLKQARRRLLFAVKWLEGRRLPINRTNMYYRLSDSTVEECAEFERELTSQHSGLKEYLNTIPYQHERTRLECLLLHEMDLSPERPPSSPLPPRTSSLELPEPPSTPAGD